MMTRGVRMGWLCRLLMLAMVFGTVLAQAAERITYIHTDGVGSPVAATDNNRNLVWREHYAPYGQRLDNTGQQNSQWFTGHYQDAATGLVYMGARWYNPEIGRFYSVDPLLFDDANGHSFNRYAYGNNNPYKYIDPDGNAPVVPFIWGAVAAYSVYDTFSMPDVPFDSGAAISVAPGAIFGAAAGVANAVRGLAGSARALVPKEALGSRVDTVHNALDPIAQARRTTAGLDTAEGARILAAGGRDLSPAQRAALAQGEVAARLPGAHAEVTALEHAAKNGLTPAQMSVSRQICPACAARIEQSGGRLTSPTTAEWP